MKYTREQIYTAINTHLWYDTHNQCSPDIKDQVSKGIYQPIYRMIDIRVKPRLQQSIRLIRRSDPTQFQ